VQTRPADRTRCRPTLPGKNHATALVWAVLIVSAAACALSEVIVFQSTSPPDAIAAALGGLWIAMPFLAVAGLAVVLRRHTAALATLLIALLVAAPVGLFLLNAAAAQQEVAQQQARAWGGLFSILLAVWIPPVQFAALLIPTLIAYGVSAFPRRPQQAETRGLVGTGR